MSYGKYKGLVTTTKMLITKALLGWMFYIAIVLHLGYVFIVDSRQIKLPKIK